VLLAMSACWIAQIASAQSNALWRRPRANAMVAGQGSSQPVGGGNGVPAQAVFSPRVGAGGRVFSFNRPGYANETPPPNPGLLAASLMAVEVPPRKKFQVHDQVTVIVREDKRSTTDTTLKNEKKWDISTDLEDWIRIDGDEHLVPQNFTRGVPNIGFVYDDKYNGKGKTERKEVLTLRVTATIIDVKPNGTLVLEAKKTIKSDDDVQLTTLTGTCRSEDVTPDNTVLSTQLANVNISTVSNGPAKDAATSGWLKKALDFLKPF
jgi:flagellar L-ring protein precursor FlgH